MLCICMSPGMQHSVIQISQCFQCVQIIREVKIYINCIFLYLDSYFNSSLNTIKGKNNLSALEENLAFILL